MQVDSNQRNQEYQIIFFFLLVNLCLIFTESLFLLQIKNKLIVKKQ